MIESLEERFLLSFSVGERVVTVGDTSCRASPSTSGTLYATIPASKYGTVQQRGADSGGFEWYRVDWDNYSYPLTDGWSAGGSPRFVSATVTPSITSVSPNPVTGAAGAQNFTINGSNFVSGAIVRLRDVTNNDGPYDKTPTSFSGNQLVISANFTVNKANWTAQVINPGNAGSTVFNFTVNAPVATPTITSVSPNPVTGSNVRQPFHIYGTNFTTSSVIKLRDLTTGEAPFVFQNGDGRFQYHSGTHLEIDPNFSTTAHQWSVEVLNGAVSSGQYNFDVVAPIAAPSITNVSPNPITADPNNSYQTLTINGSNFVSKPTVVLTWTGQSGYTLPSSQVTFVNSSQLQMSIRLGAAADNWTVKVTNPDGQASTPAGFQAVVGATVDLRGLDLYVPGSAKWGQTISVSPVDIKNYGTGAAGAFHVQWYLSKDSIGSADDILLPLSSGATSYSIAALGAGANTSNFSVSLQLPGSLPTGWSGSSFYIVMKTDSAGQVAESNENNNFGQVGREYDWDAISITANTQYANLSPQALALSPNNGLAGSDVQVSFKVVNNGPAASFATTVNIRLSTSSSDPSPSDPLLGTASINALAANGGQQLFSPTFKIPAGVSAGQKYIWVIVEPTGAPNANQGSGNAGDDLISATYTVNLPSIGFNLNFPLANRTAYSAAIRSVFDHAMTTPYARDGKVQSYTGEVGLATYGSRDGNEYKQNYEGTPFSVNGQYVGGSFLSYDGHSGYDYRTLDQDATGRINVMAAAAGVVRWVVGSAYNTLIVDHENGYTTHYLHLSSRTASSGSRVNAGDVIGVSGDFGSPGNPHLHFEVQYNGVPVDPYGWQGVGSDPYTKAVSRNLWQTSVVTPSVTGIDPTQPVATGSPQLVTIYGSNFAPNATVTLRDYGDNGRPYSNRTVISRAADGTSITIKPDLGTTAARWSVEVINPGNASSGEYSFNVLAQSDTHTYNTATVVRRQVFYNNSAWDGDFGASANDDLAIASDKAALLPGGTATFANYTSYSKGINGIMVDIANLLGQPTADDFVFRVGNDSTPSGWTAPSLPPTSVTVRPGAGVNGSDRITIIWLDNVIAKKWLQVTVRATSATGLSKPDVFYFGNAVGESGNSTANATVDSADQLAVRSHLTNAAGVISAWDYNRDKKVDLTDLTVARNNGAVGMSVLQLVALAGVPQGSFAPFRGSITWAAEGGNGNVTLSIHWPNTDESGVTIGAGYDIGGRTYSESYADLTAAGIPAAQAQEIANGAGLKGEEAHQFVLANRDLIGPITPAQRQALFDNIYPTYVSKAIDRYEYHRTHDTADGGTGLPLSVPLGVPFEDLHWAIQDMVVDFVYQGFGAKLIGYHRPMRAAMNDSFDELIAYIANTPGISQYEPGRQRIPFLEQYRNSPHDWPSGGSTLVASLMVTGAFAPSPAVKLGAVNVASRTQKLSVFSTKRLIWDKSDKDVLA